MDPEKVLKVAVLSNGDVLLGGQKVSLADLDHAMRKGASERSVVWYHRENPAGEPPAAAEEVMKLIVSHRLPVHLSARPDFSDSVASSPDLEGLFRPMREKAASGFVVILRPDGRPLSLPALKKESVPPQAVASVERMLPSNVQRHVAVVGDTSWTMTDAPDLRAANRAIPFFGILMGFSAIGHSVLIFDSKITAMIAAGCRDADVLIIEAQRAASLPADWRDEVGKTMRNSQVMVFDGATGQFKKL